MKRAARSRPRSYRIVRRRPRPPPRFFRIRSSSCGSSRSTRRCGCRPQQEIRLLRVPPFQPQRKDGHASPLSGSTSTAMSCAAHPRTRIAFILRRVRDIEDSAVGGVLGDDADRSVSENSSTDSLMLCIRSENSGCSPFMAGVRSDPSHRIFTMHMSAAISLLTPASVTRSSEKTPRG